MVIDSSAVVAILFGEPEADTFAALIEADPVRLMSAASALETSIVIFSDLDDEGVREFDLLVHKARIEIVSFSVQHLAAAREAFQRFGKGRHGAALDFGDCFSYALSKLTGEALLFKGDVFARTDVRPCWQG